HSFLLLRRLSASSTRFPYSTLFRSGIGGENHAARSSQTRGPGFLLGHSSGECLRTLACERNLGNIRGPHYKLNASIPQQLLPARDRKSTRLNSSHVAISYAVFCLKQ